MRDSGFLLVDKPIGITSYDVIYKLRKITNIRKIGHAGTLDPLATGILIVAIGRECTKQIDQFVKLDKKYLAVIDLSANTDTYDREGKITEEFSGEDISEEKISEVLKIFTGPQKQVPPMFSAKKIGGKKLCDLAREGKEVKREAVDIVVHTINMLQYKWPLVEAEIKVSSGTYIRSLAYDIGESWVQEGI